MSQTYANNDNVLSKVKFGNATYYLKDAAARAILDTFGDVVTYDVATSNASFAENNTDIPTAGQVYDYIGRQIGAIGQALNLLAATDTEDVTDPQPGDFIVKPDGSEWLYDGSAWREIGSENAYVVKTFTIAGIDMQDNITAAELKTALELGALAYKDNGSIKVTTIDSFNSFSTGKADTYTIAGTAVSVPATYDALDVTPAGSVELTAGTAAAASYDKATSVAITSSAATEEIPANYTPAGTVTVTDITVTPSTGSVATVTDAGSAYQLTDGSVSHATDTTSAFATEGVVASIDPEDSEALVLTAAGTSNAVTAVGAITYTAPSLSGSLPTFGSQNVVTGIQSATGSASFSGTGAVLAAAPAYTVTAATMTQPTFTAAFTGTSKSVTPSVATTVSAAPSDATITVASETITPTANSTEKTVSVTFGNNA